MHTYMIGNMYFIEIYVAKRVGILYNRGRRLASRDSNGWEDLSGFIQRKLAVRVSEVAVETVQGYVSTFLGRTFSLSVKSLFFLKPCPVQ